jgi:hypothetical protein
LSDDPDAALTAAAAVGGSSVRRYSSVNPYRRAVATAAAPSSAFAAARNSDAPSLSELTTGSSGVCGTVFRYFSSAALSRAS